MPGTACQGSVGSIQKSAHVQLPPRHQQGATFPRFSRRKFVVNVLTPVSVAISVTGDALASTCGLPTSEPTVQGSIQKQLDCSIPGATIQLTGGLYPERIIVSKDVTLSGQANTPTTIQWQTTQPYESTVTVRPGARLRLENINLRHSSPSVANNYCCFCQEGAFEAVNCDINSKTGSGIGLEGGTAFISDSRIQGCRGSGAVVAGALLTSDIGLDPDNSATPKAEFSRVDISRNGRSGVIALDGALLELSACTVSDNRKYGLELQDCSVELLDCNVSGNGQANILKGRPTTAVVIR